MAKKNVPASRPVLSPQVNYEQAAILLGMTTKKVHQLVEQGFFVRHRGRNGEVLSREEVTGRASNPITLERALNSCHWCLGSPGKPARSSTGLVGFERCESKYPACDEHLEMLNDPVAANILCLTR